MKHGEGDAAEILPPARITSGIKGLDTVLRGGFMRGGVYIIQGEPGAGKTVLGNQLCFAQHREGNRAVYVTLLAESHSRMLMNLRSMSFFDNAAIPRSIYYVSGFGILEDEGLKGLIDLLRREVRAHDAKILVLDGLTAAEESSGSVREFKKFIHELQGQADLANCTSFLLTNGSTRSHPEHTMVDGLLELVDVEFPFRIQRELRVRKFRGSGFLRGRHPFKITDGGIVVYPRTEALLEVPSKMPRIDTERVTTGIARLDTMLRGGFPGASTTMLLGPSGSGKTTLGLHYLSKATKAEPALYFGFYETPERLIQKAKRVGLDLEPLMKDGSLQILWQPQTERILDALAERLLDAVRTQGTRRLFIDGLGGFHESAVHKERLSQFFSAIAHELRGLDVTTVYTGETHVLFGPEVRAPFTGISSIVDNLILLRFVEMQTRLHRLLSVVKVRDSDYDTTLREFKVTSNGIDLADSFKSAESILTGNAHVPEVSSEVDHGPSPGRA